MMCHSSQSRRMNLLFARLNKRPASQLSIIGFLLLAKSHASWSNFWLFSSSWLFSNSETIVTKIWTLFLLGSLDMCFKFWWANFSIGIICEVEYPLQAMQIIIIFTGFHTSSQTLFLDSRMFERHFCWWWLWEERCFETQLRIGTLYQLCQTKLKRSDPEIRFTTEVKEIEKGENRASCKMFQSTVDSKHFTGSFVGDLCSSKKAAKHSAARVAIGKEFPAFELERSGQLDWKNTRNPFLSLLPFPLCSLVEAKSILSVLVAL